MFTVDCKTLTNENRKFLLDMSRRLIQQLERTCMHELKPLTEQQLNDKWMSIFANCTVCDEHFGWRCKESPDGVCHYFTRIIHSMRGVYLIDGTFYTDIPKTLDEEYETRDQCLFCGMPEERK